MTWTEFSPNDPFQTPDPCRKVEAHQQGGWLSKSSRWFGDLGVTRRDWRLAIRDLVDGARAWPLWTLLGTNDIRLRYKRSRFGQFWITLSMGVFIGGIGLVYSSLFSQPVQDYIPYLAVNITVWTLISGAISESTTIFPQSSVFLRQEAVPKTVFILRLIVRHLLIFAHNLAIVPVAFLLFLYPPSILIAVALPGLLMLLLVLFLATLMIGLLSTRYRDLPQIIQNGLQLLFFVTPVMWRADQITGGRQAFLGLNPFASFMAVVAEPILGRVPPLQAYVVTGTALITLACLTLPLFARCRARLVYWL